MVTRIGQAQAAFFKNKNNNQGVYRYRKENNYSQILYGASHFMAVNPGR